jgi:hypothetical protein
LDEAQWPTVRSISQDECGKLEIMSEDLALRSHAKQPPSEMTPVHLT